MKFAKILAFSALLIVIQGCTKTAETPPQQPTVAQPPAAPKFMVVCADDLKKLCAGVVPGDNRLLKCLKENAGKASKECQTELAPIRL